MEFLKSCIINLYIVSLIQTVIISYDILTKILRKFASFTQIRLGEIFIKTFVKFKEC